MSDETSFMFSLRSIDLITIKKRSLILDISDRVDLTASSKLAFSSNTNIVYTFSFGSVAPSALTFRL